MRDPAGTGNYIHHNPVIGKWNLCNEFTDYPHSSAAFYYDNKPHPFVDIISHSEVFLPVQRTTWL